MRKNTFVFTLGALLFALCDPVEAQQAKIYRVGVLAPPGKAEERVHILRLV